MLFCVSLFFYFAAHDVFEIDLRLCVTCNMYHVILVNTPPFIHSVADGHWGCLPLWFITGDTALAVCAVCVYEFIGV